MPPGKGSPSTPSPATTPDLHAVIADVIRRRAVGELVDDAAVIDAHPELMPQLKHELAALAEMHSAATAANSAPSTEAVASLTQTQLDEPIRVEEDEHQSATSCLTLSISGYQLMAEIKVGGQATVYRAVEETTGQTVAIKVVHGGPFLTRRARSRFERETTTLAALDHPHIVRIRHRGRTPEGTFFFVMDYIDGVDLDKWAATGASQDTVLEVFRKIALAVQAGHDLNIVHRDLKPSNIMVDRHGEPHVLDFGLARQVYEADGDKSIERLDQTVTVTGNVIGSLRWSSPEQAAGRSRDVGQGSDVYSLGVILYELLTGISPYAQSDSILDTIDSIRNLRPIPFAQVRHCRFAALSPTLEAIVLKAMEKSPDRRYRSAGEMAEDIRLYCGGAATLATPAMPHRRNLWLAAAILAGLLLLTGGGYWFYRSRPVAPLVVELPRLTNSIGMTFVRVPPGTATIGPEGDPEARPRNNPQWVRMERPYYVATTETTIGQYKAIMGSSPAAGSDDLPVTNVTWADAADFCRRLSRREGLPYRLPSEVEWEYACHGGISSPVGGTGRLPQMAWFADNSSNRVNPPARKFSNHWGLYDMSGNVAEWALAARPQRPAPLVQPPPGGMDGRDVPRTLVAILGGSYADPKEKCYATIRSAVPPEARGPTIGFRVILDYGSLPQPTSRSSASSP